MPNVRASVLRGGLPSCLLPVRRVLVVAVVGHPEAGKRIEGLIEVPYFKRLLDTDVRKLCSLSSDNSFVVGDRVS